MSERCKCAEVNAVSDPRLPEVSCPRCASGDGEVTTLPEFLLARIAEDEAGAKAARFAARAPTAWPHWSRLLAECEAKRRQIAHLIRFMEGDYAPWNEEHLQIMATVYADHPDYREEWKP